MELSDAWNIKFSAPHKSKCAWCDQPAKVFWNYEGKYICKSCIDDIVASKEAEIQSDLNQSSGE